MNLIKCDKYLANSLLNAFKYENKSIYYSNVRTLFTFKGDLNRNYSHFSPQKHLFFNENNKINVLNNRLDLSPNLMPIRCLSKGKDKPKEKKKGIKPKVVLTDEEMNDLIPINELKLELNNVILKFKNDLISNINVRSNAQSIEHLIVEMNGSKHSLNEIANITRKSPQLVVLNLSSMPDAIKPVLTAIADSGMNLSPQQEGTVIYLPIPKVTREHREGLANNAKQLFQKTKDQLKDIHSSFTGYVKKQKKSHVSEELIFNVNENIKYLIDSKVHECEHILEQKLNELLK